ncbi:taurine catabolism dioxygenase [Punctularia strigosozonata HHB-11173 SS5]|uniref:taurine catabolism dioxygenase n=1 Tax=Punctularia strigosozonata (strain HHB-11173) TaxID=741275 RepID=UPI0004417776|nr:taurine catabolism dioxygenase [Punctularia strigosozonata HHB-11173 SS5]EIN08259.1 taurine catabolism dioxygenase [Punctularia strigosozonata HHB-11173 SS5]
MAPAPSYSLGSLANFDSYDETPHIGTRFPSASTQLSTFLTAPNSRELVKDLGTLVSHRGVVFFSNQDITLAQQKELARLLGEAGGKPKESGLHKHPVHEATDELGDDTLVITSERASYQEGRASRQWHTDITFEPIPSDYAILKLHTLPRVGGDTLWASGYEAYDRLSPKMRSFLEGLTAIHDGSFFHKVGIKIVDNRGHIENSGEGLTAVHPVIRTHPVTGYKSLFVNKVFTKKIVELNQDESDALLDYLTRHVSDNHDLQVRFRWTQNDVAIWDNRCTFHTATRDYGRELRVGNRVLSIGERPYFDPNSKSRREALGGLL